MVAILPKPTADPAGACIEKKRKRWEEKQKSGAQCRKANYYFWVGVFLFVIFSIIFLVYFATMRIDYVWAWHKIPSAFLYHKQVEIKAEIQGTVASITPEKDQSLIKVKGTGEEETFTVPTKDLRVSVNDFVYPGDVLASYGKWQAGIMLQGVWITLKVSLFSIIFGIIIGIIGGLSRISDNPAAKWLAITYVELIRGSPLLVQIFIWYFVVGTMVNQLLLATVFTKFQGSGTAWPPWPVLPAPT